MEFAIYVLYVNWIWMYTYLLIFMFMMGRLLVDQIFTAVVLFEHFDFVAQSMFYFIRRLVFFSTFISFRCVSISRKSIKIK